MCGIISLSKHKLQHLLPGISLNWCIPFNKGREMPAAKSVFLWTWADHVFFAYTYPERKDNLMSQGHLLMLNGYMGPRILNCLPEVPARERCCSPEKEILPDTGCACTMHPKGEALCFSWGAAGGGRNQSYRAEEGLA